MNCINEILAQKAFMCYSALNSNSTLLKAKVANWTVNIC